MTNIHLLPEDKFFTYLLELPEVKNKYLPSAIQFLLKQTYPGNIADVIIDYRIAGRKVICTLISKEKYKNLPPNVQFFSPFYYFSHCSKDGKYICEYQGRSYITEIKNGSIEKIEIEEPPTDFSKSIEQGSVFRYSYNQICRNETGNKLLNNKSFKASLLFQPVERNSKKFIWITVYILSFLLLIFTNLYAFNSEKKVSQEIDSIKKEYDNLRTSLKGKKISEEKHIYPNNVPINEILSVFADINENIKIKNLYLSNKEYRIECENSNALDVLQEIKKSDLFRDSSLKQSYIDSNGKEHFFISGGLND